MDSPAHPYEELGVTRLWFKSRETAQQGCGHIFCRKWCVYFIDLPPRPFLRQKMLAYPSGLAERYVIGMHTMKVYLMRRIRNSMILVLHAVASWYRVPTQILWQPLRILQRTLYGNYRNICGSWGTEGQGIAGMDSVDSGGIRRITAASIQECTHNTFIPFRGPHQVIAACKFNYNSPKTPLIRTQPMQLRVRIRMTIIWIKEI